MSKKGESKYKYEISTDKEPTKFIVYKATNLVNGKIYIGQTRVFMFQRMSGHHSSAIKQYIYPFARALYKYGFENFKWEIIDYAVDINELDALEIYYISTYNSFIHNEAGYNVALGNDTLRRRSPKQKMEMKNKQSTKRRLFFKSEKNRENFAIAIGSKSFNVYTNDNNCTYVGTWINKTMCSEVLKIDYSTVKQCLRNNASTKDYIFIYVADDNLDNRKVKIKKPNNMTYDLFNVYNFKGDFIMSSMSQIDCANRLNIPQSGISNCLLNKRHAHYGYIFIFQKDDTKEFRKCKLSKTYNRYSNFNVYDSSGVFIKSYCSKVECSKELQLNSSTISKCLNDKQKAHKGYTFYYTENDPNLELNNQNINKEAEVKL